MATSCAQHRHGDATALWQRQPEKQRHLLHVAVCNDTECLLCRGHRKAVLCD